MAMRSADPAMIDLRDPSPVRSGSEHGSVLLLFPAAFLIVLLLGSLAIDAAVVFLHQRELAAAADAAANDAVVLGLDPVVLRNDGLAILDPVLVRAEVDASLRRRGILGSLVEPPHVEILDGNRLRLSLVARADYVIAPALPGAPTGRTIRASVTAVATDQSPPGDS